VREKNTQKSVQTSSLTKQGVQGSRTNQELRELYKTTDLAVVIKRMRLAWLGYVIGMDQTGVAKDIFQSKPDGRGIVERPRLKLLGRCRE
jgi:hypothetical protein